MLYCADDLFCRAFLGSLHGMKVRIHIKVFCTLFLAALLLVAAPAGSDNVPIPEALKKLQEDGRMISYMGHAYGVDGWRIAGKDGSNSQYAYTTPEGGILLGILMAPDGTSVTNEQLKALKARMDGGQEALPGAEDAQTTSVRAEKLYADVENSGWARTGDVKAPYLYMFINTLCAPCQQVWKDLEPVVKSGRLQVRLVPFGKQDENRKSGASLLSVDDPAAAWNALMRGDEEALSVKHIKPGAISTVDMNTTLYRKWNLRGPPFMIYRRPNDGQIMVVAGQPENMMLILADLLKEK